MPLLQYRLLPLANAPSYCGATFATTAVQRAEVTPCNVRTLHRSSSERHRAQNENIA